MFNALATENQCESLSIVDLLLQMSLILELYKLDGIQPKGAEYTLSFTADGSPRLSTTSCRTTFRKDRAQLSPDE